MPDLDLQHLLFDNQFFWAGLLAYLVVVARNLPQVLWGRLRRRYTYSLSFFSEDATAFRSCVLWVSSLHLHRHTNNFRVVELDGGGHDDPFSTAAPLLKDQAPQTEDAILWHFDQGRPWALVPSFGYHLFFHQGWPLVVERTQEESGSYEGRRERITLTFLRRQHTLSEYIEGIRAFNQVDPDRLLIHNHVHHNMSTFTRRKIEGRTLVFEDETLFERLAADMQWFMDNAAYYYERNLHWHRGYGFFGPPGTGKTSMIVALASRLSLPIHKVSLINFSLDAFLHNFARIHPGTILLFEDLDLSLAESAAAPPTPIMEGRPQPLVAADSVKTPTQVDQVLLNIFDGMDTPEGVFFFITSNHPERINEALLRPGRIDKRVAFSLIGPAEIERYIEWFYREPFAFQGEDEDLLCEARLSPATVRSLCLAHPRDTIEAAVVDRLLAQREADHAP